MAPESAAAFARIQWHGIEPVNGRVNDLGPDRALVHFSDTLVLDVQRTRRDSFSIAVSTNH
ncbi:hypothetical protein GX586_09675 [bacterium]|nr:hypothetical protein [bacterium]